jgi:hypothetical protein
VLAQVGLRDQHNTLGNMQPKDRKRKHRIFMGIVFHPELLQIALQN